MSVTFAALALALLMCVAPSMGQHAHCTLKVTWAGTDCATAFSYVVGTVKHFTNPAVAESNYTLVSSSATPPQSLHALHTSPVHLYVDNILQEYSAAGSGCALVSHSQSTPTSIYDYSTNFCNSWNLVRDGPKFTYKVEDCLFHPKEGEEAATCNKY